MRRRPLVPSFPILTTAAIAASRKCSTSVSELVEVCSITSSGTICAIDLLLASRGAPCTWISSARRWFDFVELFQCRLEQCSRSVHAQVAFAQHGDAILP